jgi:hypothetical protein
MIRRFWQEHLNKHYEKEENQLQVLSSHLLCACQACFRNYATKAIRLQPFEGYIKVLYHSTPRKTILAYYYIIKIDLIIK